MSHNKCDSKKTEQLQRKIDYLDGAARREAFPPEKLLDRLPIKMADTILDLGAGTGYLAIPAANMVEGLVYALDMDRNMLELIQSKAANEAIENVRAIQGTIDNIPISNHSIDVVLASLVLHEIKPLPEALQQIKQVLKEDGYFVCVEIEKKDYSPDGPPRISSSKMEQEILNAGMEVTEKFFPTDSLYVLVAKN